MSDNSRRQPDDGVAPMKGYAALVSSVLIGMSDAMQPQQPASRAAASKARKRRQ
jgi:hypothetical protein